MVKALIKSSLIVLGGFVLLTGCAGPRQNEIGFAGGSLDNLSQVRGYDRSSEFPENDYRNILSDPGPF